MYTVCRIVALNIAIKGLSKRRNFRYIVDKNVDQWSFPEKWPINRISDLSESDKSKHTCNTYEDKQHSALVTVFSTPLLFFPPGSSRFLSFPLCPPSLLAFPLPELPLRCLPNLASVLFWSRLLSVCFPLSSFGSLPFSQFTLPLSRPRQLGSCQERCNLPIQCGDVTLPFLICPSFEVSEICIRS